MKKNLTAILLAALMTLTSTSIVFSESSKQVLPDDVIKKYEKCHFKEHENSNHYHIYYPKYDGEVGIYHVGLKKELIWIWSKDYGEEVRDIKCTYLGKNKGEAKIYLKNGKVIEEKDLFVDVYGKDQYNFYVEGNRYKALEDKLKQ